MKQQCRKVGRFALFAIFLSVAVTANAQTWNISGNTVSTSDYFGSSNNESVTLKTNGQTHTIFKKSGELKLKYFDNGYVGLILNDATGVFTKLNLTGSATDVLLGNGTFGTINNAAGWTLGSGVTYTANTVGIGTTAPISGYKMEVNGNLKVDGAIIADGKCRFYRIAAMPGDSIIRFGDSTISLDHTNNRIYSGTTIGSLFIPKGLGIGSQVSTATGAAAVAIGKNALAPSNAAFAVGDLVEATAEGAMVMGLGINGNSLINSTTNTFMMGFNSNIPTFFVGTSSGTGTVGKVGIGTTSPSDKLQVGTGSQRLVTGDAGGSALNYGTSYIGFNASRSGSTWTAKNDGTHNGGSLIYGNITGDIYFSRIPHTGTSDQTKTDAQVLGNTSIFISGATGQVGIGTTCLPSGSSYKLTIEGIVSTREMWVKTTPWCDYVFKPEYKLRSYKELENYIAEKGHLPGILSQAEIESKEGYLIGDMNRAQMEKIEENTLYILDLNTRLETAQKENAELKKEMEELKKLVQQLIDKN